MFAAASREADLDGQQTWHVQTGTAESHTPSAPSLSLCLYWVSGSGFARGQYNGSQCLERLKARAALFKCPEISFQGDGLQLPWEHRGLASAERRFFLFCLTLVTLFAFGFIYFLVSKRVPAHALSVVIRVTWLQQPGWTALQLWAWPPEFDHLSGCLMVFSGVALVSAVQWRCLKTHSLVVGNEMIVGLVEKCVNHIRNKEEKWFKGSWCRTFLTDGFWQWPVSFLSLPCFEESRTSQQFCDIIR